MMSKQINHRLVLLSIGSFLALGAILVIPTVSAKKQQPGMATGTARNASIVAATEALLKETSDLRELSILKDVKSGAQSRAEIERMIIKNLDEESSPAERGAGG